MALSATGFSPAPKLSSQHCFLEQLARGALTQRLVQSFMVVEIEVGGDLLLCPGHALVGLQLHLLIFEAAPEPLDEDVVAEAPASVRPVIFTATFSITTSQKKSGRTQAMRVSSPILDLLSKLI